MDEQEAILNRLKQNQAYNDHIVSQQASIIKQFDRVEDAVNTTTQLQQDCGILSLKVENLQLCLGNNIKQDAKDISQLFIRDAEKNATIDSIKKDLNDLRALYFTSLANTLSEIKSIKESLEASKARWMNEAINLHDIMGQHRQDIHQELQMGLAENLKQIPETPPYIQDLKDAITHKMRIFEIEVGMAVDKANHAEMLYKVVEKRTRQ